MQDIYYHTIDQMLRETILRTKDFYVIVQEVKGVHPIEILRSLDRLYKNGDVNEIDYEEIIFSAKAQVYHEEDSNEYILPLPHLIDYDWRFSNNGIATFIYKINNIIKSENIKNVVFIGSPSLFRFYVKNNIQGVIFYLIDINAYKHLQFENLKENFKIINCNVNYEIPESVDYKIIKANLVIMDPPWYPEYYNKFFDICNDICDSGCFVYGVFPPVMTRDTIPKEKNELSKYIFEFGFNRLSFESHMIEYSTPPFEINVLRVNNIFNYPLNWRVGDIFYTKRMKLVKTDKKENNIFVKNTSWFELCIGKVRIKCKQEQIKHDDLFNITLKSLYPDNIYPSVSRRYIGNQEINVWTSGNRVFYCTNVPLLTKILQEVNNSDIVSYLEIEYNFSLTNVQKTAILEVHANIKSVLEIEEREAQKWSTYEI